MPARCKGRDQRERLDFIGRDMKEGIEVYRVGQWTCEELFVHEQWHHIALNEIEQLTDLYGKQNLLFFIGENTAQDMENQYRESGYSCWGEYPGY
jgi:hypothetical protein